jgi:casein kinase 1
MLGASIEERFAECDKKFSLKTVCMLGLQLMNIIQNFHEKNLVHRNISLKNFQFGKGHKCCSLFFNDLIDCKRYRNKRTQTHCEEKKNIHTNRNIFWTASHYESK